MRNFSGSVIKKQEKCIEMCRHTTAIPLFPTYLYHRHNAASRAPSQFAKLPLYYLSSNVFNTHTPPCKPGTRKIVILLVFLALLCEKLMSFLRNSNIVWLEFHP